MYRRSYAAAGRKAEAVTLVNQVIEASRRSHSGAVRIAAVFALLGQTDETIAWLEQAYKEHDQLLVYLNVLPDFDAIRADPRFQDLVRRIGIPSS